MALHIPSDAPWILGVFGQGSPGLPVTSSPAQPELLKVTSRNTPRTTLRNRVPSPCPPSSDWQPPLGIRAWLSWAAEGTILSSPVQRAILQVTGAGTKHCRHMECGSTHLLAPSRLSGGATIQGLSTALSWHVGTVRLPRYCMRSTYCTPACSSTPLHLLCMPQMQPQACPP